MFQLQVLKKKVNLYFAFCFSSSRSRLLSFLPGHYVDAQGGQRNA